MPETLPPASILTDNTIHEAKEQPKFNTRVFIVIKITVAENFFAALSLNPVNTRMAVNI